MSSRATLRDLKPLVCSQALSVRTGIVLVTAKSLGAEADECARAGLGTVGITTWLLDRVEEDATFVDVSPSSVIEVLEQVCASEGGDRCLGVLGFDLLVAGLRAAERPQVWRTLRVSFRKRAKALLFFIPSNSKALLPPRQELEGWTRDGRVAYI